MLSIFQRAGLSFERLKTFCAVVRAQGISQAAPGDPNRQSQFSRQVKELEEFFGTQLINRKRGKFELTPAGAELHSIAESHFRALDSLLLKEAGKPMTVRIAGGESVLHGVLLPLLPKIQGQFPSIILELFNCRTSEAVSRLKEGRVDFGLLLDMDSGGEIEAQPVGDIRLGLYIPDALKVSAAKRKTPWELIADGRVATLAGGRFIDRFMAISEERQIRVRVGFRGSSYVQVIDAARALKCLAIVPDFIISEEQVGDFVALEPERELSRKLSISWKPRNLSLFPNGLTLAQELKALISVSLSRNR